MPDAAKPAGAKRSAAPSSGLLRRVSYFLSALLIRAVLAAVRGMPLHWRVRIVGALTRTAVRVLPHLARRGAANLRLVYPEMPAAERQALLSSVGRNIGRTLTEILFNPEYARIAAGFTPTGPGLAALDAARKQGRGAILVSGHFGQWEAVRHALRAHGTEVGAVYRPNNNPYYEPIFRRGIAAGGAPIIPKGNAGNRALLRHLRGGGVLALLMDQYVQDGAVLTFMGHPAPTALSAAQLALRYDVPLIPVFGIRRGGARAGVEVILETPIAPTTAERMMQGFNDRLAARVHAHPAQWHWLHQRWRPRGNDAVWPPEGWVPPRGEE